MKNRLTVIAGLISGAVLMLATAPAMAHANVAINIGGAGYYVQPAPAYVSAPPTYVQPRQRYVQPYPVYADQQFRPVRYQRDWDGGYRRRHDQDRDGIPDRHDHDRDGDGVPNRFDRRPNNPYRN